MNLLRILLLLFIASVATAQNKTIDRYTATNTFGGADYFLLENYTTNSYFHIRGSNIVATITNGLVTTNMLYAATNTLFEYTTNAIASGGGGGNLTNADGSLLILGDSGSTVRKSPMSQSINVLGEWEAGAKILSDGDAEDSTASIIYEAAPAFLPSTVAVYYGSWTNGISSVNKGGIKAAFGRGLTSLTKYGYVLTNSASGWDSGHVSGPRIYQENGTNYMFYFGGTGTGFEINTLGIGVAYSTDGTNWTKYSGNPILSAGQAGMDDGIIYTFNCVKVGTNYFGFYNGNSTNGITNIFGTTTANSERIGLATATNVFGPWTKFATNPIVHGIVADPTVLPLNSGGWGMIMSSAGGAHYSSFSKDLTNWTAKVPMSASNTFHQFIGQAFEDNGPAYFSDDLHGIWLNKPLYSVPDVGSWRSNSWTSENIHKSGSHTKFEQLSSLELSGKRFINYLDNQPKLFWSTSSGSTYSTNASFVLVGTGGLTTKGSNQLYSVIVSNSSASAITVTIPASFALQASNQQITSLAIPASTVMHMDFRTDAATNLFLDYHGAETLSASAFPLTADANFGGFSATNIGSLVVTGGVSNSRGLLVGTNNLIVTNNFVGIGVVPTNAGYSLQIRTPYGGAGTLGGLLIDNQEDLDLRGIITLRAGLTNQGRRYIYFENYTNNGGWFLGANSGHDFIMYNGNHFLSAGDGANGNLLLNGRGTGGVQMNTGAGIGGGSGGLTLLDGDTNGGVKQFSFDSSGGIAWQGLSMQALSTNTSLYTKIYTTTNSGFLSSKDKLSLMADSQAVVEITNAHTLITTPTKANTALTVSGQQWIGYPGAHSDDYGLNIGIGSFSGSDGYISFQQGAGATEYGRINVDNNGVFKIQAQSAYLALQPTNGNVSIGMATTPAAKLDVTGDIRASTTITATNGLLGTNATLWGGGTGTLGLKVGGTALVVTNGNVGIGTDAPKAQFHSLKSGTAGTPSIGAQTSAVFQNSGSSGTDAFFSLIGGNAGTSQIIFGDTDAEFRGRVTYNHSNDSMDFYTGGSLRTHLDSTGLGIGVTVPAAKLDVAGTTKIGTVGTVMTNIRHGISGAMVLGSVTVTDTNCTANTRYFFSAHTLGTVSLAGGYYASTRNAGASFVITSSQATETSTIDWMAIEP